MGYRKINAPVAMDRIKDYSVRDRIMKNSDPSPCGCWLWNKYTNPKGYGQIKIAGKAMWAHRVSYAAFNGPIKDGMFIHHLCGNPRCVNPKCLVATTMLENTLESNGAGTIDTNGVFIPY